MKKLKLILSVVVLSLFVFSCEKDGGDSVLNLTNAAIPKVTKAQGSVAFIDLTAISNGDPIALSFTIEPDMGKVASMEVVGYYKTVGGELYKGIIDPSLTTFPKTYTITENDLYSLFSGLNSADDLSIGDRLTITANVVLENGDKFDILDANGNPNFGSNFAVAPFSPTIVYNVACPSDLGGTYSVVTSGTSTDPLPPPSQNPLVNYPYTVTLTDNGGGDYTISDAFGGVYILWYTEYGLDFEVDATITDVCGTISSTFIDPFGSVVNINGSVDSETGVITLNWDNDFGDMGTSILTPQ